MCISSNHKPAFVLYRLPDTQEILCIEGESRLWDGKWPEEEGFLMVPFHGQGVWISGSVERFLDKPSGRAERQVPSSKFQVPSFKFLDEPSGKAERQVSSFKLTLSSSSTFLDEPSGRDERPLPSKPYPEVFHIFHHAIKDGKLKKIVLSHPFESRELQSEQFERICERYPHSMVYLLHTPQTGTWMGATPEALLSGRNGAWSTMALAGTKTSPQEPWDEKNKKEQAVVGNFIRRTLEQHVTKIQESERYTMQSGNLYHLRTDFHFCIKHPETIPDLLACLHPTPAVCGLPQREAMDFILANEGYDRQFYAGYLGPVNARESGTYLAVNIRCAQLFSDGESLLYAGSGLMPDSTLESEWAEVQRKGESLLG